MQTSWGNISTSGKSSDQMSKSNKANANTVRSPAAAAVTATTTCCKCPKLQLQRSICHPACSCRQSKWRPLCARPICIGAERQREREKEEGKGEGKKEETGRRKQAEASGHSCRIAA